MRTIVIASACEQAASDGNWIPEAVCILRAQPTPQIDNQESSQMP